LNINSQFSRYYFMWGCISNSYWQRIDGKMMDVKSTLLAIETKLNEKWLVMMSSI
jgi:hypothetical protein